MADSIDIPKELLTLATGLKEVLGILQAIHRDHTDEDTQAIQQPLIESRLQILDALLSLNQLLPADAVVPGMLGMAPRLDKGKLIAEFVVVLPPDAPQPSPAVTEEAWQVVWLRPSTHYEAFAKLRLSTSQLHLSISEYLSEAQALQQLQEGDMVHYQDHSVDPYAWHMGQVVFLFYEQDRISKVQIKVSGREQYVVLPCDGLHVRPGDSTVAPTRGPAVAGTGAVKTAVPSSGHENDNEVTLLPSYAANHRANMRADPSCNLYDGRRDDLSFLAIGSWEKHTKGQFLVLVPVWRARKGAHSPPAPALYF